MDDCCDPKGYQAVFSSRFARRVARRYSKRGLSPAAARMAGFVSERGLEGATVLEIGGGVGELQVELLRRGAARVTNLEISTSYEVEAKALLERSGLSDRVTRRFGDIATEPELAEPADVVVLHRVVCCYPDYQLLLSVAANHARRLLVYSHPADNVVVRAAIGSENLVRRLQRNPFRAFVHPPDAMVAAAEGDGLRTEYRHRAKDWQVVGLVR
ncbi:class I SAM-dependent methyltransferase [Kribbella pittospori]|uniref:Class I SAM-dependent methyltransferase n=1 Tax=Kribbella pittospori TaxID=722689 RepID=A0A4R0KG39_9ACTN|nr:methyltransferase domain-containing protein [Kribbella pittospori]TCC59421.1 class I SAM-dependent methyltransferase [Kribbella pittospori]